MCIQSHSDFCGPPDGDKHHSAFLSKTGFQYLSERHLLSGQSECVTHYQENIKYSVLFETHPSLLRMNPFTKRRNQWQYRILAVSRYCS